MAELCQAQFKLNLAKPASWFCKPASKLSNRFYIGKVALALEENTDESRYLRSVYLFIMNLSNLMIKYPYLRGLQSV